MCSVPVTDQLVRDVGAVELAQMRRDVAGCHAPRVQVRISCDREQPDRTIVNGEIRRREHGDRAIVNT
jgi:hypothetical protein